MTEWSRSTVERIVAYCESRGYRVGVEYRDIDVFPAKRLEENAIEVESISAGKDLVQTVWTSRKP
jgi:hypothetical protein